LVGRHQYTSGKRRAKQERKRDKEGRKMGKEKWKIKNREKRCEVLQTASVGPAVL